MKKVALVLLMLVMSSLCFVKATAQDGKPAKKKSAKPETESGVVVNDTNLVNQIKALRALVVFRDQTIKDLKADIAGKDKQIVQLNVQTGNNDDSILYLNYTISELQKEMNNLKQTVSSLRQAASVAQAGEKLSLPLFNYTNCKDTTSCDASLLDDLMGMPDDDFRSGDGEARKKITKAQDIISRLDAVSTAHYIITLKWDKRFEKNKEARKKRLVYVFLSEQLEKRKNHIIATKSEWPAGIKSKPALLTFFEEN